MKNPYYINFLWTGLLIIVFGFLLFYINECGDYYFKFNSRTENIYLGILSSAILLFLFEVINYVIDRTKFGFLKGRYRKETITQKNEGGLRSSDIPSSEPNEELRRRKREELERTKNIKFINDSCYHELSYYRCDKELYLTMLEYNYHGIYTGYVEYYNHAQGTVDNRTKAHITLTLNSSNKMTGSGSYKHADRDDLGRFEFQVDDQDNRRIIVSYSNVIPSGLAEGYEIWKKLD